ncbi:MAG TPA: ATP-binding cassette domain-containing protein [Spirochaetota bacterium]|nr:ATP-binding cassette domain-containing protein [Spirochaetota bacterium]
MLRIQNLYKSYGAQTLFDGASVTINPKEKVGLVGRNGHGKSTLMKIIIGEDHADDGAIELPKNYRLGYITQHLTFTAPTVREEGALGLQEHDRDDVWKVEKILSGLGFSKEDFDRPPSEFSGGYQVRLHLAKVLVSDPDMLLLDEPTNYLDITSIRWLENFLRQWPRELILITHDRAFMDAVVTHTVAIHRRQIRKIEGDTTKLYEQIAREEEVYEKTRVNDEKKRRDAELFINRFRAKARLAGLVQSRIKNLERMEKRDKLENIASLEFSFNEADFPAKYMLRAENLSFGYAEDAPLFENFSITVAKGDRICVIGKNGRGKTTLLRVLAEDLNPWKGVISYHAEVKLGYFAQTNVSTLEANRAVEDEILVSDPAAERQKARGIAGAMMFEGDAALKKISVLSGGEKSRVMLGKIIMKPTNMILLDEPTNHLDMQSCDALLEAVDNFDGAMIIVTHNEMFLHAIANRLIVFQGGKITVFDGTYEDFLEKVGWEDEREEGDSSRQEVPVQNKKEARKIRSEIITRRNKTMKPLEESSARLEKTITKNEARITEIQNELISAAEQKLGEKIQQLSKELHDLQSETEKMYDELGAVMTEIEAMTAVFDEELSNAGN